MLDGGLFGQGSVCFFVSPSTQSCLMHWYVWLWVSCVHYYHAFALTLIPPVFGEIITDYCLKKISPVPWCSLALAHSLLASRPLMVALGWLSSSKREKAKKASKQRPRRERGGGGEGPNVFQFLTTCMVQATKTMAMATAWMVWWPALLPSLRPFLLKARS